LGIELAAARIPHLSAPQIASRIDDVLALLTTGPRNAPMRQQTLRATLDWSHGLLSEPERTLFRRLAVFPSSWTLQAAEAVCASGINVFGVLGRLIDRSLVVTIDDGDERRFRMLEIIRQYAQEQLKHSGESEEVRSHHLSWCVQFVSSFPFPPPRPPRLEKVFQEHDNLRAALRWAMDTGQTEPAFRLSTWAFWYDRSYSDAIDWFVELFAIPVGRGPSRTRAAALCSAGLLASVHGQYAMARTWFEESLTIAEQMEDQHAIVRALSNLGSSIATHDDLARARTYIERALVLARQIGNWGWEVLALRQLGRLDLAEGDLLGADARARESVALARATSHSWGLAASLCLAGRVAAAEGATERAEAILAESLTLAGQLDPGGNQQLMADALLALGDLAVDQDDVARAREYLMQALLVSHEAGAPRMIARALEQLGELSFAIDPERAVYLAAVAVGVRQAFGALPQDPWLEARLIARQDRWLTSARHMLGDASFATVWHQGLDLPVEDVARIATMPALSQPAAPEVPIQRQTGNRIGDRDRGPGV
jgi:tetratricopeptide (TPR) repeat protein